MKKFKIILIFTLAISMAFTSCKKDETVDPVDQSPIINFIGGGTYISSDATVTVGEDFVIGIIAASNTDSNKDLVSVKYTVTTNNVIALEFDSVFSEKNYNVDYVFRMDNAGEAVFKFEVTDKVGEKSSISLTITAEPGTTPISDPEALYWERLAGAAATGLDSFGLKWENNIKAVNVLIEKNGADKFVQLTPEAWTNIATQEDLAIAVEEGTDMDTYKGISADAAGTYDEVLAVKYNGEYFLMHLTSSEITVDNNGAIIKIYGESKK